MTELLAPAGDIKSAYTAINSGADAVYIGLKDFSARASAENFDSENLGPLCASAHALGVKIYVAINTVIKQSELLKFVGCAIDAHNAGADALIIQDIFLGKYLKQTYPQMRLHLSTQAGVNNVYGATLAKRYGFDRVILARETPLKEIEKITKIIETEVFIQGALCTCFSGQCYMSSFAGGNSGNRGRCKQPCRKLYSIDRTGFTDYAYALSLSDLSVGENIIKFIKAGVSSFKIEGRMRRPEYVSAAVRYYRSIIDDRPNKNSFSALKRTYNRGNYTKGLAFGQDKTFLSRNVQGHIGEYCGTVKVSNGKYICHSTMQCSVGDAFKILRSGKEVGGAAFAGAAKQGFYLFSNNRLLNGDKVFLTTDARLNASLLDGKRMRKVILDISVASGERVCVSIDGQKYFSSFVVSQAVSHAVTSEQIIKCFRKVDTYPFEVSFSDISISNDVFIPVSSLNSFRREVYADYYADISKNTNEQIGSIKPLINEDNTGNKNNRIAVIARDLDNIRADIGIFKPDDYTNINDKNICGFEGEKFLYLPPFFNGQILDSISQFLYLFDGVYCDGYWAIEYCREKNVKLFAGCGFNITNSLSLAQLSAQYVALSKELTLAEARPLERHNTFYLSAGDIKVMDLLYCPFEKSCSVCDRRSAYNLTDEDGRTFPLRRYTTESCVFELYNCVPLCSPQNFTGTLLDCTLGGAPAVLSLYNDETKLKEYYIKYTSGHSKNPVI